MRAKGGQNKRLCVYASTKYDFKITTYHFDENLMTGAMSAKIICLLNSKTMTMKLMQSRLENIMKIEVMKNISSYQYNIF